MGLLKKKVLEWSARPIVKGIFAAPRRDRQGNEVGGNYFDITFQSDTTREKLNLRVHDPGPLRRALKEIDLDHEVIIRIYQRRIGKKEQP